MGFDLIGLKAVSKKGEYFRNNVWWWRPLAEYVVSVMNFPLTESVGWGNNGGHRVSNAKAKKIAKKLYELLAIREVHKYALDYELERAKYEEKDPKSWYPFSVDNVKEFADFCNESGGFEIC